MKKIKILPLFILMFTLLNINLVFAEKTSYKNWEEVANAMSVHIDDAVIVFNKKADNYQKDATDKVNVAYYKFYEKLGFEKTVMAAISGKRGSEVEHQFYKVKKVIRDNGSVEDLHKESDTLKQMLLEDANVLDGKSGNISSNSSDSSGFRTFLAVFGLTMREGLEAILVIAAIVAYLIKTNHKKYVKGVYLGAGLGVAFSVILAIIFNLVADKIGESQSGASQEIFEGVAMFVAVIVLFYVSNWMLSKSEEEVWSQYIQTKVEESLTKGSLYALVFSSFLAVSREGAELILFFQGMRENIANNPYHVWSGIIVSAVALIIIYLLITKVGVRLPLRPFFVATSFLMFVLCFSFAGKGVFELQEADVIGRTIIPNFPTFELLGIYPRVETLIPQIIIVILSIISIVLHRRYNKRKRAELESLAN